MSYASTAMHMQARTESEAAFRAVFSREPSICERQFLQAVALLESTYGNGWKGEGIGSNNMGAIQTPCTNASSFSYTDRHADGTEYETCFRTYSSRSEGWVDLVRTLYIRHDRHTVLAAAERCDFDAAVRAQRESGYFEAPVSTYQQGIRARISEIAQVLGEPYSSPKAEVSDGSD